AGTNIISTVAGSFHVGFSGDGGPATSAAFNGITGVAVNGAGDIYLSDSGNNRVRKVTAATGVVTTIAGTGAAGGGGNGGPATAAQLNGPRGLALGTSGDLYVADTGSSEIRKIAAVDGKISLVAGTGTPGFSGDLGPATAAMLNQPNG